MKKKNKVKFYGRITKQLKCKRTIYSFPHNKVVLGIVFLAIGSLIISWQLDAWKVSFWSSIFANIFAGLITGLVICLISGRKQRTIAELESQLNYLEELKTKIRKFQELYNELLKMQFSQYNGDEKLFDFIYDVGSHANWVNDFILQGSFNEMLAIKPTEYCKKMGYDALGLAEAYEDLHINLYNIDVENPTKKQIIKYFETVEKALRLLGGAVYHKQQGIKVQLEKIKYSRF